MDRIINKNPVGFLVSSYRQLVYQIMGSANDQIDFMEIVISTT